MRILCVGSTPTVQQASGHYLVHMKSIISFSSVEEKPSTPIDPSWTSTSSLAMLAFHWSSSWSVWYFSWLTFLILMPLRLAPVVLQTSLAASCFSLTSADFLESSIFLINEIYLLINNILKWGSPDKGSIRFLCVAWGRFIITFTEWL